MMLLQKVENKAFKSAKKKVNEAKVAKAMLSDNVDINTIAKFTGLSAKENIHS